MDKRNKTTVAIGTFPSLENLRSALDELLASQLCHEFMAFVASEEAYDGKLKECWDHPDNKDFFRTVVWIVADNQGRKAADEVWGSNPSSIEADKDQIADWSFLGRFHEWLMLTHAQQLEHQIDNGRAVLLVGTYEDSEQAICQILLKLSDNGIQTHEIGGK